MASVVDILEKRVAAAVDMIAMLRERAGALERELAENRPAARDSQPKDAGTSQDPALVAQVERLLAERAVVRERVRLLLREIDRVNW